jgi:putative ABC transport system permease protein
MRATLAVIAMNLSALRTRIGASAVVVIAIFALAGISTSMLSLAAGFAASTRNIASPTRAMITLAGALTEQLSSVPRAAAVKIGDMPGVRHGGDGRPVMATEVLVNIPVVVRENNAERGFGLRGTSADVLELHPEYKMIEGRMFQPGLRELVVGQLARDKLLGMNVGDKVSLPDGPWTIVGVFTCGDYCEWRLFGDVDTLMTAFRKTNYTSVLVQLENERAFDALKSAVAADPTMSLQVERERAYWDRIDGPQFHFYEVIGLVVGGIIGLGVVFASANMMYAAVSRRLLEIATQRALGFGAGAVIASVLAESVALAALGAVIGIFAAWAACDGAWYTGGVFSLAVTPKLAAASLAATLGVGVLAALFPAIRAARLPVATALQAR